MTFKELIRVIAFGFAKELPVVGGLISDYATAVEKEREKGEREREKQVLLNEIGVRIEQSLGRQQREEVEITLAQIADEGPRALTSTSVQVQAKGFDRLETAKHTFQRRFLYIASDNYASAARTAEIASQYGFLWRSYHAKGRKHVGMVAGIDQIKKGDLIVLAYRDNGHFFVLSPLMVMDQSAGNDPINDSLYECSTNHRTPKGYRRDLHNHEPFVLVADPLLDAELPQQRYHPDPIFHRQCGLNVRTLLSDVMDAGTKLILQGRFESPEPFQQTIWRHDDPKVHRDVTTWIAGL